MSRVVACVDLGATFTKAALIELGSGRLLATGRDLRTVDLVVAADYVLAAAGLLATDHPGTAYRLLRGHLDA